MQGSQAGLFRGHRVSGLGLGSARFSKVMQFGGVDSGMGLRIRVDFHAQLCWFMPRPP